MRAGFTLIEVLVALVLFEFAMLALAASAAVAARNLAAANLGTRAQEIARNRVQQLRATHCPSPTAGSQQTGNVAEYWSVRAIGQMRVVSDSVEYPLPDRRRHRLVVHASTLCRP